MATVPDIQVGIKSHSCPGDRVVYAERWQGTLDTPSADDIAWLAANPTHQSYEPTAADWDDMARWCEWCDRNDSIRRDADQAEGDAEAAARYAL